MTLSINMEVPGVVMNNFYRWCGVFIVVPILYVSAFNGVTCSNDGSHYALLRSLLDTGSPVIDNFVKFTEYNDYSRYGDHFYSDRPPGTAVLAAPFYRVGSVLPIPVPAPPSKHDAGNPALFWLLLAPACAAWLTGYVFFLLQRRLGVRPGFALLSCCALLIGSVLWKYGTILFSHAFSACLVLGGVYIAMTTSRWTVQKALALGVVLGASVAVEYQNAVFVLIVVGWVILDRGARSWKLAIGLAIGLAVVGVPLLFYFKTFFGGWFSTSYSARVGDLWARDIVSTFSGNMLHGLRGLIWYDKDGTGWLWRMPFVAFGLVGFGLVVKRERRELLLPLAVVVVMVLLFSAHFTFHGYSGDGRYILPYFPLALLPASLLLQTAYDRSRLVGGWLVGLFVAGALWGVTATISLMAHPFGQTNPTPPYPVVSFWRNPFGELGNALPNLSIRVEEVMIAAIVGALLFCAGVGAAFWKWRRHTSSGGNHNDV
jgi:hypothetical protein